MQDAQLLICASEKDLPWLNACLRSVQKYWVSTQRPIIVVEPQCRDRLPNVVSELECSIVFQPKSGHSYIRLTADCYTSAQMVMFIDSHDMFTRPCNISTFIDSLGHPVVFMEAYTKTLCRPNGVDHSCVENRRSIIEDLTGINPSYEYTVRDPMLFHRHSIRRLRESIEIKNKRPLRDLMMNYCREYFCEFNFLGAYCYEKERSSYEWIYADADYDPSLKQFFGITDPTRGEDFDEIRRILQ